MKASELIGQKIHVHQNHYETITEIVYHTNKAILVKVVDDKDFELYEVFVKRNGEWDFKNYAYTTNRALAKKWFSMDYLPQSM